MPRFQIGDCLAFHPHLCRLVRPGEHAQALASKRRRANKNQDRPPTGPRRVAETYQTSMTPRGRRP